MEVPLVMTEGSEVLSPKLNYWVKRIISIRFFWAWNSLWTYPKWQAVEFKLLNFHFMVYQTFLFQSHWNFKEMVISDVQKGLCIKYLLWVSEGIGGYRKWRSIVYVYGFEMGIGNWPNMNKCLLCLYRIGYREGIGNIRRVSEMYEGYRKY